MRTILAVAVLGLSTIALVPPVAAQVTGNPGQDEMPATDPASIAPKPAAEDEAQALAKQLANPVSSLISIPLQSNWDFGAGVEDDGLQYKLNIQPVIPVRLNEKWNLISRTIVPVIAQRDIIPSPPAPDNSQFGLSDTVQSFFLSPQVPGKSGIIWGAGPVILVPTATDDLLGSEKWGAGPTIVVLKQTGPITIGALGNHIWSFAGNGDRDRVSSTFLQPFVNYTTRTAMSFTLNTETTYDWVHDQWTVPVNLAVAQLFKPKTFGLPFPMQIQVGYRHYFEKPRYGPSDGLRLTIVAMFPRK